MTRRYFLLLFHNRRISNARETREVAIGNALKIPVQVIGFRDANPSAST